MSAPLPAITTTSPARASPIATSIASRAVDDRPRASRRARRDLGGDRAGLLGARIVGGDDRPVGELGGDPAHHRPLLAVPVAARAEDDDQPPVAEAAGGAQHVLERVGRVGVVDDDRERLPLVDRLEPARDAAHALDAAPDRGLRDVQRPRGGDRAERVRAVEAAAQVELDRRPDRRRA